MKKYQFKSEASLKNFIEGLDEKEYKILEDNTVEIVASPDEMEYDMEEMKYYMSEMKYEMKYLYSELNYLYGALDSHQQGHLPPIQGAGKMDKCLKALGLNDDYEVRKPILYANARGEVEVELPSLKHGKEKE